MKKIFALAFLLLLALFVSPSGTATSDASFTASVTCGFAPSGRGSCTAYPQGAGYSYSWWASGGASVANRNASSTSAACGGNFGTIYVQVTSGGSSSTAYTTTQCSGGR